MNTNPFLPADGQTSSAPQSDPTPRHRRVRLLAGAGVVVLAMVATATALWAQGQRGGPVQSLGTLQATPPNFVFNAPTPVTFTIVIDTPTLNPTTVELQRVDASGNVIRSVGRMRDDGQDGDARGGDKTFTLRATLSEPEIGKAYFRVVAAFRGNSQNAQSQTIAVDIDPLPLPPDPGEAGKLTLEGIDSDEDGLRDDVQIHLARNYSDNHAKHSAARQYALALTNLITSANVEHTSDPAIPQLRAIDCLYSVGGVSLVRMATDDIARVVLNTDARLTAFRIQDSRLPGVFDLTPRDQRGAQCV